MTNSYLDEEMDPDAPRGSRPYCNWLVQKIRESRMEYEQDVRTLQRLLSKAQEVEIWKVYGALSLGALLAEAAELDDDDIDAILRADPATKVGDIPRVGKPGRPRKQEPADEDEGENSLQVNNNIDEGGKCLQVNIKRGGGNTGHVLARLLRDAEESDETKSRTQISQEVAQAMLKRIEDGLTPNAAAIELGWRKPPSPFTELKKWWRKATADEQQEFLSWMNGKDDSPG